MASWLPVPALAQTKNTKVVLSFEVWSVGCDCWWRVALPNVVFLPL